VGAVALILILFIAPTMVVADNNSNDNDVEIIIPNRMGLIRVEIYNHGTEPINVDIRAERNYKYRPERNDSVSDQFEVTAGQECYFGWFYSGFCSDIIVDVTAGETHIVAKGFGIFGYVLFTEQEILT
jgi:hypothetical protein